MIRKKWLDLIAFFINNEIRPLCHVIRPTSGGRVRGPVGFDAPFNGAVICAVCPESAWLVTFLIGNVSTGVVTWTALRCGASGESDKKIAAAPLSKTAAAAAVAKTWFAKQPLDYMLYNRFPWKRSGRRSSMWPPYSLRRNLSAATCRPCDRSLTWGAPSAKLNETASSRANISRTTWNKRMKFWTQIKKILLS